MKLSNNFDRYEFECNCCKLYIYNQELLDVLEHLRTALGNRSISVLSGTRCSSHNSNVGGASKSQHLYGTAADIVVKGVDPTFVSKLLRVIYPNSYGIGEYSTFTHIDVRDHKARWKY